MSRTTIDEEELSMIRGDMSVTEFFVLLWSNKVKVALLILALAFGPGVYRDWQQQRAEARLVAAREAVDFDASIAGMMIVNAWRSCRDIGIVNDMERCAAYDGRLLQEQSAPMLAKLAIEHRASYYKNCFRFHSEEFCGQLLRRSVALSDARPEGRD
jgi:hypothetical protein